MVVRMYFLEHGISIQDVKSNKDFYISKEFFEKLKRVFDKFEEFKKDNIESITIRIDDEKEEG